MGTNLGQLIAQMRNTTILQYYSLIVTVPFQSFEQTCIVYHCSWNRGVETE